MNNFEKIEAYIEGWMSIEDRAAFEAELQFNEALKKDYEDWLHADKILKKHFSVDNDEEQLKEILTPLTSAHFKEEEKPQAKIVPFKKYLFTAVAAAAILVVYLSLPTGIEDYNVPEMPQAVVRGAEELSNKGAVLFNEGEYEQALPLLQQQAAEKPDDATANFFYAISLVETEQYETALPVLEKLANGASVYKEDAAFFAAFAAYKSGKKDEAIKYAQLVSEGNAYYKKAQKIIKKLD